MKKLALILTVAILTFCAQAIPSRLDVDPNLPPSDPLNTQDEAVKSWIQTLVGNANGSPANQNLPGVGNMTVRVNKNDADPDGSGPLPAFGANTQRIQLPVAGYAYVALHWGGGRGNWETYYTGDETGSYTFVAPSRIASLNGYRLFSPQSNVPDGGATVAMLTCGLLAAGALRRKLG